MKIQFKVTVSREELNATTAHLNNIINNINTLTETSESPIDCNKLIDIKDTYYTKLEKMAYFFKLKDELTINFEVDTMVLGKFIELADESLQWAMPALGVVGMMVKQGPSPRMRSILDEINEHETDMLDQRVLRAELKELVQHSGKSEEIDTYLNAARNAINEGDNDAARKAMATVIALAACLEK